MLLARKILNDEQRQGTASIRCGIIYNMKRPYSADLNEEYNRYRDMLEEKLEYEE